jgi:radial spoke head protein 1
MNGEKNGVGVYHWRDGARYVGGQRESNKSGSGVMYRSDGLRYEGEWANDVRNGYGAEWDKQGGLRRQGIWAGGALTTPLSL